MEDDDIDKYINELENDVEWTEESEAEIQELLNSKEFQIGHLEQLQQEEEDYNYSFNQNNITISLPAQPTPLNGSLSPPSSMGQDLNDQPKNGSGEQNRAKTSNKGREKAKAVKVDEKSWEDEFNDEKMDLLASSVKVLGRSTKMRTSSQNKNGTMSDDGTVVNSSRPSLLEDETFYDNGAKDLYDAFNPIVSGGSSPKSNGSISPPIRPISPSSQISHIDQVLIFPEMFDSPSTLFKPTVIVRNQTPDIGNTPHEQSIRLRRALQSIRLFLVFSIIGTLLWALKEISWVSILSIPLAGCLFFYTFLFDRMNRISRKFTVIFIGILVSDIIIKIISIIIFVDQLDALFIPVQTMFLLLELWGIFFTYDKFYSLLPDEGPPKLPSKKNIKLKVEDHLIV